MTGDPKAKFCLRGKSLGRRWLRRFEYFHSQSALLPCKPFNVDGKEDVRVYVTDDRFALNFLCDLGLASEAVAKHEAEQEQRVGFDGYTTHSYIWSFDGVVVSSSEQSEKIYNTPACVSLVGNYIPRFITMSAMNAFVIALANSKEDKFYSEQLLPIIFRQLPFLAKRFSTCDDTMRHFKGEFAVVDLSAAYSLSGTDGPKGRRSLLYSNVPLYEARNFSAASDSYAFVATANRTTHTLDLAKTDTEKRLIGRTGSYNAEGYEVNEIIVGHLHGRGTHKKNELKALAEIAALNGPGNLKSLNHHLSSCLGFHLNLHVNPQKNNMMVLSGGSSKQGSIMSLFDLDAAIQCLTLFRPSGGDGDDDDESCDGGVEGGGGGGGGEHAGEHAGGGGGVWRERVAACSCKPWLDEKQSELLRIFFDFSYRGREIYSTATVEAGLYELGITEVFQRSSMEMMAVFFATKAQLSTGHSETSAGRKIAGMVQMSCVAATARKVLSRGIPFGNCDDTCFESKMLQTKQAEKTCERGGGTGTRFEAVGRTLRQKCDYMFDRVATSVGTKHGSVAARGRRERSDASRRMALYREHRPHADIATLLERYTAKLEQAEQREALVAAAEAAAAEEESAGGAAARAGEVATVGEAAAALHDVTDGMEEDAAVAAAPVHEVVAAEAARAGGTATRTGEVATLGATAGGADGMDEDPAEGDAHGAAATAAPVDDGASKHRSKIKSGIRAAVVERVAAADDGDGDRADYSPQWQPLSSIGFSHSAMVRQGGEGGGGGGGGGVGGDDLTPVSLKADEGKLELSVKFKAKNFFEILHCAPKQTQRLQTMHPF